MTANTVFLIIAAVLFIISAVGVNAGRFNLMALGLFFLVLTALVR